MKKLIPYQLAFSSALAVGLSFQSNAQTAPAKQWDKTFGGSDYDPLSSIQQTADGGFILGGTSISGISRDKSQASKGVEDFWVIKLDINGNKLWDKTFGGNNQDILFSLQQTLDGGYILGGYSNSGISGDKSQANKGTNDFWVVKIDANGNKIWDKTLGGSDSDVLYSLQQTSDGGYILGGQSTSGISGDKSQSNNGSSVTTDYWVIKLDASGNKLWDKTLGGNSYDDLYFLKQTADGGYILGGDSDSGISGDKSQPSQGGIQDYWLIKLDAAGNKVWDKTFGGSGDDKLRSLVQNPDGSYTLGGSSTSNISGDKTQLSNGATDYWIVKVDGNGIKQWDKTIGGISEETLQSLQRTSDGGYILGGSSLSGIGGDKTQPNKGIAGTLDYWVVKLDSNGNKAWDNTIGGDNNDQLKVVKQTSDSGYILGGYSISSLSGDKSQASLGFTYDYWVVKLSGNQLGVNETANFEGYQFQQNQPNPFSESTAFNFTLPKTEDVELTIYNNLGQTVGKLLKKYEVGNHEVQMEEIEFESNLKSGIYFCQFSAGAFTETKRIVKL